MNGVNCGCKTKDGRQVLWCETHNGWIEARRAEAKLNEAQKLLRSVDCSTKVEWDRWLFRRDAFLEKK